MKSTYQQIRDLYMADQSASKNIINKIDGPHFWIILNRPKRYNAFTIDMYFTFRQLLVKANEMEEIKFIIVTGSGDNFSSGNDLGNFMDQRLSGFDPKTVSKATGIMLQELCEAIIDSSKPIFAVLQGKTIGFAFTQLAIYDKVFAAQSTQLMAPLVKVAQGPQMCSSYLFPKIFGSRFGEEIIVQGNKFKATELEKYDFLSTYPSYEIAKEECLKHCSKLNELQWNSYINSRRLIREQQRELLKKVNQNEIVNLVERWNNPELPQFIMNYMSKQKQQKQKPKL